MRKRLKIWLLSFVIGIFGLALFSFFSDSDFLNTRSYYYYSPCSKPISYKIGTVDSRFGLTNSEIISATKRAANTWNKATGIKLFTYDPEATLSINMVFDRRQSLNTQINQLESDLSTGKTTLDTEIDKYNKLSADFEKRSIEFKEKVDFWNSKGGAPPEEYDSLIQEQQSLKDEADRLNSMAASLNLSTAEFNNQVSQLNQTINSFNKVLDIKPEEGIYNPSEQRIDIFFNNDRDELIGTIAHEFGHARGLGHSTNPMAIMFPTATDNLSPIEDEINRLKEICQIRPFYEPLKEILLLNIKHLKTN